MARTGEKGVYMRRIAYKIQLLLPGLGCWYYVLLRLFPFVQDPDYLADHAVHHRLEFLPHWPVPVGDDTYRLSRIQETRLRTASLQAVVVGGEVVVLLPHHTGPHDAHIALDDLLDGKPGLLRVVQFPVELQQPPVKIDVSDRVDVGLDGVATVSRLHDRHTGSHQCLEFSCEPNDLVRMLRTAGDTHAIRDPALW